METGPESSPSFPQSYLRLTLAPRDPEHDKQSKKWMDGQMDSPVWLSTFWVFLFIQVVKDT